MNKYKFLSEIFKSKSKVRSTVNLRHLSKKLNMAFHLPFRLKIFCFPFKNILFHTDFYKFNRCSIHFFQTLVVKNIEKFLALFATLHVFHISHYS
jgi:hypothetical protein